MLGNFSCFCCRLQTFKIEISKKLKTIRVSNSLDLDKDQHSVGHDLGPTCSRRQKSPLARKEFKTLYLLVSTADNLCKQFGPDQP